MWDSCFTYVGNLRLSFLCKEIDLVETGYPDECFNSTEARAFDVFQFVEMSSPIQGGEKSETREIFLVWERSKDQST